MVDGVFGGVEAVRGVWAEEGDGEGGRMAGGVEEGWENEGGVEFEGSSSRCLRTSR